MPDPMLKNTLTLPTDNDALAAQQLNNAIDAIDTILMLVFGGESVSSRIAGWADQLANTGGEGPDRHVVWIRTAGDAVTRVLIERLRLTKPWPVVAVTNRYDSVKARLDELSDIDPISLEAAYAMGYTL